MTDRIMKTYITHFPATSNSRRAGASVGLSEAAAPLHKDPPSQCVQKTEKRKRNHLFTFDGSGNQSVFNNPISYSLLFSCIENELFSAIPVV